MLAGQLIAGGWLSFFFFNDPAATEIYALSLPDALPIFTPTGNAAPLVKPAICVVTAPGQLSVPTSGEHTSEPQPRPQSVCRLLLDKQLITGGWLSVTATGEMHVAGVPAASVPLKTVGGT